MTEYDGSEVMDLMTKATGVTVFVRNKAYSRDRYVARRLKSYNFIRDSRRVRRILFKMVPTKITRASRSDPIRSQYCRIDPNIEQNFLNPKKENGTTGTITGGVSTYPMSWTTPSFAEGYLKPEPVLEVNLKPEPLHEGNLKPEPLHEDNMFNEMDCEFFQDLVPWCPESTTTEQLAIDPLKKREETTHITDTLHTTFSPQGWDVIDAIYPGQAGLYSSTPNGPLSPNMDGLLPLDNKFLYNCDTENEKEIENLDILNLPVVIGNMSSEETIDFNPPNGVPVNGYNINTTLNTENISSIDTHKIFLHNVDEEDSLDMKLGSVVMRDVENHVIVFNNEKTQETQIRPRQQLSLNIAATPVQWPNAAINTPDILSYVEQLEKEKYPAITIPTRAYPAPDTGFISVSSCPLNTTAESPDFSQPVSPKSETRIESDLDSTSTSRGRRRKRRSSEDSDATYTPYEEETPRKRGRRSNIELKDKIQALEELQQLPKARRGRPPKRRDSNVSSVCSLDDNASCASTHEYTYRIARNKNNEASKRSRMNRKLKELQMEQLAIELEERNKKLKVKADILEDMTKRLKDALMSAIIQKQ
ncbi:basic region leucine zipper domain-containing protein [Phthorimaea operculella]|nr:basic region leucine zipper domain-containing protein [Phthorimaea operculella]